MEEKQENTVQTERKRNPLIIPFVITLIGAIVLVVAFFLPFASAIEDYREYLQKYSEEMYAEEFGMTNGEAVDISLFEFEKMYANVAGMGTNNDSAIVYLVIIALFALFIVLTTLFTIFKKPIAIIIFNLFSFGVFELIKWDFEDRGLVPSRSYDWGFAGIAYYIGIAVVMVGAILLLIAKIKVKRQRKLSVGE